MTDESALLRLPLSPGIFADIPDMSLPQRSCEGTPNHACVAEEAGQPRAPFPFLSILGSHPDVAAATAPVRGKQCTPGLHAYHPPIPPTRDRSSAESSERRSMQIYGCTRLGAQPRIRVTLLTSSCDGGRAGNTRMLQWVKQKMEVWAVGGFSGAVLFWKDGVAFWRESERSMLRLSALNE